MASNKCKVEVEIRDVPKFEEWAILELFGHQKLAGRVTEQQIGGASFVRVDVPDDAGGVALTKMLNPSAIYSIAPCTETVARAVAQHAKGEPIARYDVQELIRRGSLKLEAPTNEYNED